MAITVLSPCTVSGTKLTISINDTGVYATTINRNLKTIAGKTYTVAWDGTAYECVADGNENGGILGNFTDEYPFMIIPGEGETVTVWCTDGESHTLAIYEEDAPYNGSIDLISGLRPKNGGSFPLVHARDVQMPDGSRLSDFNGLNGAGGASAYEIAVEHGFEGDEEAWLESLKGERGATAADYYLPGDANGDGIVDEKDAELIQYYLNGANVEINLACADVDGDGEVTPKDAARINQYLAGEDVKLLSSPLAPARLPTVTADDNGKVLQVVDGTPAWVEIANSAIKDYIDSYIEEALGGDY